MPIAPFENTGSTLKVSSPGNAQFKEDFLMAWEQVQPKFLDLGTVSAAWKADARSCAGPSAPCSSQQHPIVPPALFPPQEQSYQAHGFLPVAVLPDEYDDWRCLCHGPDHAAHTHHTEECQEGLFAARTGAFARNDGGIFSRNRGEAWTATEVLQRSTTQVQHEGEPRSPAPALLCWKQQLWIL